MPKELERDLGLFSILAISIGAMIGSGIFILPALAVEMAGPSVVLAYLLAGVLVLPAALSKSEMATAMPESGGTYLYIERGMGPLLGTVAGLGTWFALSFKGALALVGGVPYLLLLFDVPASLVTPVALALAAALVAVNLFGAKQTGRLQIAIVGVMLAALVWFVVGGAPSVDPGRYDGFFADGVGGLLAATGLVFVSYAGVTKIASVAEEIEDPGRTIPLGILGSLAFTTALYGLIVFVMLGVSDPATIADTSTPMAVAAEGTLGTAGVAAIVLAAILALVSTANAGILSSSRYPFAMSRDGLVPAVFATVSDRFKTPSASITLTGVVLLVLIAFVPILDIAKLASAFQILVFVLVNLAHVAFRRGSDDYAPTFESPLYPWMQLFGIGSGLVLLTQMGTVPLVGAVVMTLAGIGWYLVYARSRIDREGAAIRAVRRRVGRDAVERTHGAIEAATDGYRALVALPEDVSAAREETLLRVAAHLARANDGRVTVVQFDEVHDQVPLEYASEVQSPADVRFEERTDDLAGDLDVPVDYGEVVSHDTRHAVVNYAAHADADVLLVERDDRGLGARLFGGATDWILRHAPCDTVLVDDRGIDDLGSLLVVGDARPYDPTKIAVADALAVDADAEITLQFAADRPPTAERRRTLAAYREEIARICDAPIRTDLPLTDGGSDADGPPDADVLVAGVRRNRFGRVDVSGASAVKDFDRTALFVHPHDSRRPGRLSRLLERWTFR